MSAAADGPKNVSASSVTPASARFAAWARQSSMVPAIAKAVTIAIVEYRVGRFLCRRRATAASNSASAMPLPSSQTPPSRPAAAGRAPSRPAASRRPRAWRRGNASSRSGARHARHVLHHARRASHGPRLRAASWRLRAAPATKPAAHMFDTIRPSASSPQALTAFVAACRHEDRDVGARAIVELDAAARNTVPVKLTSSPRSSARMMTIASRSAVSERLVSKPMRSTARPQAGADAEPRPARRQFVERADLHGDQRRVPAVRIEHAGADALRPGRDRAGRGRRQDAAREGIFRKPDAVDAGGFRGARLLDAAPAASCPPCSRTLSLGSRHASDAARAAARNPPARNARAPRATARPPCGTPWSSAR